MKLIDWDKVLEWMHRQKETEEQWSMRIAIENYVDNMPTIDAVTVIRCRDCKWYDTSDISGTVEPIGYRCKKVARLWREPDDFCKGAERREE